MDGWKDGETLNPSYRVENAPKNLCLPMKLISAFAFARNKVVVIVFVDVVVELVSILSVHPSIHPSIYLFIMPSHLS